LQRRFLQQASMTDLFIRIFISDAGAMGPGKARLLELIDQTGSIRAAAKAMNVSYRRAWLLLKETETIFGAPVLDRQTGGRGGGGTALTRLGRDVVTHYRAVERKAAEAVAPELAALHRLKKS
jgi:molybdate transport system regulatory protein